MDPGSEPIQTEPGQYGSSMHVASMGIDGIESDPQHLHSQPDMAQSNVKSIQIGYQPSSPLPDVENVSQ